MEAVTAQVELLEVGKPLEAFDAFYDEIVLMYANDVLFASGAAEGRAKQEPFIAAAESISGRITDIKVVDKQGIFVFRNLSTFTDSEGTDHQIDGLSWQKWEGGLVVEERYYDNAHMVQLIAEGILNNPEIMFSKFV